MMTRTLRFSAGVKLNLRTRQIDCYDYGASPNPPVLHRKETFLHPERCACERSSPGSRARRRRPGCSAKQAVLGLGPDGSDGWPKRATRRRGTDSCVRGEIIQRHPPRSLYDRIHSRPSDGADAPDELQRLRSASGLTDVHRFGQPHPWVIFTAFPERCAPPVSCSPTRRVSRLHACAVFGGFCGVEVLLITRSPTRTRHALVTAPPNISRDGWTAYTGSTSWLYYIAMKTILRDCLAGGEPRVEPCISSGAEYHVTYRHRSATYAARLANQPDTNRGLLPLLLEVPPTPGGDVLINVDDREYDVRSGSR